MTEIEAATRRGTEQLKKAMETITGSFPNPETAYHLPISYALTGMDVRDGPTARQAYAKAGGNPLVACECLLAARTAAAGPEGPPYTGFIPDTVIRKLGYSLVDGSILGMALLTGSPASADEAAGMARELQEKYMLTFLAGDIIRTLSSAGVKTGLDYRLVPLGSLPLHGIYFIDIVARVAMMFGGVVPGDAGRLIAYAAERAKVFTIVFPGLSDEEIAFTDTLRALSIPVLTTGGYEGGAWIKATPGDVVGRGMEAKDIRVKVTAIPIPMGCSPAFEGKSIRKEEMYVEFGGGRSPAFELLRLREPGKVVDGRVTVIGPEIGEMKQGSAVPLGILVEVAGKRMRKEFEPVLERRIHNFVNYGEGSWHVAQRNLIWVRLSKEAVAKGVKVEHLGRLIAAKFKMDFPELLDAVQVTLLTDGKKVLEMMEEAGRIYEERDRRVLGMKDDEVDIYYSCTLCQTFAPNHVCVITPQRPALCGAISWLDGRTAYEISPSGANQPIKKGKVIDAQRGEFEGVNEFVRKASHGEVSRCSLYSLMEFPMTCCGCFECIAVVLPEVNGVMVVNREFTGETPCGMSFSTLAGTIGGGAQTPGFAGISKGFILSERFLQAEDGIERLVWIPAMLKEELEPRLRKRLEAIGKPDLFGKIATEEEAETIEELQEFLAKVDHPALSLRPLI
ncbi:MAG TPA: acetyl-CoA decarbonylase/synthase complex subunit alpha/beta [Methanomicrobiales archaeon]|jgi:acetyl-CoA decarbonylase/synthase complex subunit beta/acetyl-CoA synthase|nr:acetyl-CoA decarbonylase/synthase complex subunit alpha/beta [Methanomicrobiales archaeon]